MEINPRNRKRQKRDNENPNENKNATTFSSLALLNTVFPFGKYDRQHLTVAHFLLDTSYLEWCESKKFWTSHPLRQLLIKESILLPAENRINPNFYLPCLEVTQQYQKSSSVNNVKIESDRKSSTKVEHEEEDGNLESCCSICLESCTKEGNKNIRYVWMPCGHATLCQSCYFSKGVEVSRIKNCPVCKRELNSFQPLKKIFL